MNNDSPCLYSDDIYSCFFVHAPAFTVYVCVRPDKLSGFAVALLFNKFILRSRCIVRVARSTVSFPLLLLRENVCATWKIHHQQGRLSYFLECLMKGEAERLVEMNLQGGSTRPRAIPPSRCVSVNDRELASLGEAAH